MLWPESPLDFETNMKIIAPSLLLRLLLVSFSLASILPCSICDKTSSAAWVSPLSQDSFAFATHRLDSQYIQQFALTLTNRDRSSQGLPPMEIDPILSQAAQYHAEDMLRRNYFSHYSPEGETPSDRLAAAGRKGYPAENIAMTEDPRIRRIDPQLIETFQHQWMSSESHRSHLLNPNYVRFGYGLSIEPATGRVYVVQMFSRQP